MGRRKIEIKMVKDTNTRQVTFSKRRTGLFKKANELSILCGAEVAIVVFSPGNKPYSFGHPGVDAVAAKYLTPQGDQEQQDPPTDGEEKPADSDADYGSEDEAEEMEAEEEEERDDSDADVERMNRMLADVAGQVREAERQGAVYDAELEQRMALEGRDELQGLFDSHAELKGLVKERIKELEVVEIMLNFAENAVDGTSRNKRRRIN